jgi:hypothetical protein
VPLPFVVDKNTTVEVTGSEAVQIKGPGESLEKRQATLQVCFRGVGEQPKLAIIFRGQGNITDQERRQLDATGIDYYFQKKAWADPDFTKRWMQRTMKEAIARCVGDNKPILLFADNLSGQDVRFTAGAIGREAKEVAQSIGVEWWNTVAGCTDTLQPVDAGMGRELKRRIGIISSEWLDVEENLIRWEGGNSSGIKPLKAWERRVLMAEWAAEAWKVVCARPHMLRRYFEKTGCHLCVDPSYRILEGPNQGKLHDSLIKLEQMIDAQRAAYMEAIMEPYDAEAEKLDLQTFLSMCSNGDLKDMLKESNISSSGLTRKDQYVTALIDSGWTESSVEPEASMRHADIANDIDNDTVEIDNMNEAGLDQGEGEGDEEEDGDDDEDGSDSEDENDLDDSTDWHGLPALADSLETLCPTGFIVATRPKRCELGARVIVCGVVEDSPTHWSCGLVTTKYSAGQQTKPKCDVNPTKHATALVTWPSEATATTEVRSALMLTKNTYYKRGSQAQRGAWVCIYPRET